MAQKCFRRIGLSSLAIVGLSTSGVFFASYLIGFIGSPSARQTCTGGADHLSNKLAPPPVEKGISLGLFSMDPSWKYKGLIDEIVAHGASHINLVWVWWQKDVEATHIAPKKGWSATTAQVVEAGRYAKMQGLHVTLFPIVRLIESGPGQWRGKIKPRDEHLWWENYDAYLLEAASIARHADLDRLVVGSELLTREHMRKRWAMLIERIRLRYPRLELMYSSNWDHYEPVQFWDLVDVVGLTAYWELGSEHHPSVSHMVKAWQQPMEEISRLSRQLAKPVVITEIGYPSLTTGVRWPWDETRKAEISLETQRVGYEAFVRAASRYAPTIQGVYFWNWFGFGGKNDGNYTPRGKPAADIVRCWFMTQPKLSTDRKAK